jgi:hypothetical protein
MTSRIVTTEYERKMLIKLVERQSLPFTASLSSGKSRTWVQNKLQRKWMKEVSEQLGDRNPEDVRAYCKLTLGVPILRAENDDFCEKYDRIIRPLDYKVKLELMAEPMDFPVTRLMSTKQFTTYLDTVFRHFSEQGVILTIPDSGVAASHAHAPGQPVAGSSRQPPATN